MALEAETFDLPTLPRQETHSTSNRSSVRASGNDEQPRSAAQAFMATRAALRLDMTSSPRASANNDSPRTAADNSIDLDALPPIPGTRRLGNRKLSKAQSSRRPSEFSLYDGVALSPRVNALRQGELISAPWSPKFKLAVTNQPSPLGSRMPEALPAVWDADAFRAKRSEAQLALQIIPRYAAAIKQAGARPEFENIMRQSIEMHMEDEYEAAMLEIVQHRSLARAFLGWKEAAKHHKKIIEENLRMNRPTSFCAKFEVLASQQPRVQLRRGQGSSVMMNDLARPRGNSSVTTDATRPSVADESDPVRVEHLPIPTDSVTTSEEDQSALMMKQLYANAAKAEIKARQSQRIPPKRSDSSSRIGQVIQVLGRVASFRKPNSS